MTSTLTKSIGEKTPAPPLFSYAQAAKGRPSAPPPFAVQMTQSIMSNSLPTVKDANSITSKSSQGYERDDRISIEKTDSTMIKIDNSSELTPLENKNSLSESADSPPSSPGVFSISASSPRKTDAKEDDFIVAENGSESMNETNSAGEKTKRQKSISQDSEKPEMLVPAPLPAVNFWQQRKEKLAQIIPTPTPKNIKTPIDNSGPVSTPLHLNPKSNETKKRGKQSTVEGGDRAAGMNQNGVPRDTTLSGRGPKKNGNGMSRFKDDQSNKRNGARGSRHYDKEAKSPGIQALPPVEDANSWPTPETVLYEDKRKVLEKQERDDKEEIASNKPRQKEKWLPVPYTPTVTFNTPMPTRGGRTRGAPRAGRSDPDGRSAHGQNGTIMGEKHYTSTQDGTNSNSEADRPDTREGTNMTLPPSRRRSTDIVGSRKSSVVQYSEKPKTNQPKNENHSQFEHNNSARNAQVGHQLEEVREPRISDESFNASKIELSQPSDGTGAGSTERRSDQNMRNPDHSHFGKENSHQPRERIEGRPERGRGGFRGRVGHSNYTNGLSHQQSNFSNGTSIQHQNGYNIRQGPYSPPLVTPYNAQFVQAPRVVRVGHRSQSIPNNSLYGRFSQNGGGVSQALSPLQTSSPMYDYTPMQSMSASPYPPYIDHVSVHAMVTMQLEYYFSIDNLCKDVYLRKHMDSQGFVFLSFIAGFKRIQALTQDFELIRFSCQESEVIELVRGEDGIDRLRRKDGWEKWVLTMEERDESTKNPGPTFWHPPQYTPKSQYIGQMILTSPHPACMMPYPSSDIGCALYNKDGSVTQSLTRTDVYQSQIPLSATVPDFAPGLTSKNTCDELLEAENTFHEDEVANLTLVFASSSIDNCDIPSAKSLNRSSSRTFSNGSIDRSSITDGIQDKLQPEDRPLSNGSHEPETYATLFIDFPLLKSISSSEIYSRSKNPSSPKVPDMRNGPPVMWVKGQKHQVPISERNSQELYVTFRARALRNREMSAKSPMETHPDMKLLYEFWSHFLCRNFNSQMYSEFRRFALEDARLGSYNGVNNLISYYDEILNSKKKVIPETLARHYVDLVTSENSEERLAFLKFRAAWRNGALDLKSRKKIDGFLSPKLREELEQAPHRKSE
ncbi:putative la domain containing protein [Golovinomyces cichoracearum]|uniref:Putative la domain containing protein n=1 Tax=Golovinomyces cichoracearum TaxID=62708 RepID=A0A420IAQ8_9PEZI|nr:putative la domain containing protein [Golovinomyces cichoracearum]